MTQKVTYDFVCTYSWIFKDRMVWNNRIGWKFVSKLINVWYGIRACWVENFVKINKRTPTFIRYSRVNMSKNFMGGA